MLEALGPEGYDILVRVGHRHAFATHPHHCTAPPGPLTVALIAWQVDGAPFAADGGIGLVSVRKALATGKHAVLANKAPLVVAFDELVELASRPSPRAESASVLAPTFVPRLLFSATVCGGLPVVNLGTMDVGVTTAIVSKVEGVFNSTTNFILAEMGEGRSFDSALAEAQRLGIAEADPSLDIDGHDTANKLIIIANAIMRLRVRAADVTVTGVRGVTPAMVAEAAAAGEVYKLVATAEVGSAGMPPTLTVQPRRVSKGTFLGGVQGFEMGIVMTSDLFNVISMKIDEPSVEPTSAAVLRDVLHCVLASSRGGPPSPTRPLAASL